MATITYKYIPLGDPDVANNQSRGISYQFNGYAPVTFKDNVSEYLDELGDTDPVPDFSTLLKDCNGVVLFKDLNYVATDGVPVPSSSNYNAALSIPGSHMFTDLNVEAADEFQMSGEYKVAHGSTVIEIPISDTMMGNRLSSKARVDAIVLYGQAYNIDFYSEVQQGTIERAVAIGLIIFDVSPLEIDPSSGSMSKSAIRITLGITSREVPSEVLDQSDAFKTWMKFAGSMHVVNNDLLTNSAFCIRGNDVEPIEQSEPDGYYAEQLHGGDVIDVNSRMFFTNDVGDENKWDNNVDFGSPAKLTVLNRSDPITDNTRLPQTVIGKVKYTTDSDGYKHARLEGVHQSFFEVQTENKETGAIYEQDWFARKKPGVSLFTENESYEFNNGDYDYYLKNSTSEFDKDDYESNVTKFGNGNQLFCKNAIGIGNTTSINSYDVMARGNSMILNSARIKSFSKAYSDEDIAGEKDREKKNLMYDTLIANSQDIEIYNRVKGSLDTDWGNYTTRAQNTVLNSKDISIDNRTSDSTFMGSQEYGRNLVAGSCNLTIKNADMNVFLGIKGIKESRMDSMIHRSEVENSKDSVYIGGAVKANMSRGNFVVGLGYTENYTGTDVDYNTIETYKTASMAYGTHVSRSVIIGRNCHITTVFDEDTQNPKYDHESNVYLIGKGLRNDIRQTHYTANSDPMLNGPTIIMGWNNQRYFQNHMRKLLVLGGGNHYGYDSIPKFKYNAMEISVTDTSLSQNVGDWTGTIYNRETTSTLTDIKGRSIDYGSSAIQLGFIKGRRSDANYGNYNFFSLGRINLFKLYALRQRIMWVPESYDGRSNKGYLVYDSSIAGGDTNDGDYRSIYSTRSVPWCSFSESGSTCLAELVDDNYSFNKHQPQKPENI